MEKVREGSILVDKSGQALAEIVSSVEKVNTIISEITEASNRQSSGIDQVCRAVTEMDEMTQQNATLVEEASASSQLMSEQARHLNEMVARFSQGKHEVQPSVFPSAAKPSAKSSKRVIHPSKSSCLC